MVKISASKRLALGLGVMVLGLIGALPFRHAPSQEASEAAAMQGSSTLLGEGVALQVPGQPAIMPLQTPHLQPLPPVDDPSEKESVTTHPMELATASPAPQLPDQYHPLFRPDNSRQTGMGRVWAPEVETQLGKPLRRHTIRDGDTLASLALRYLGSQQRADEILEANRSVLSDPEVLPVGVQLVIPRPDAQEGRPAADSLSQGGNRHLVPLPAVDF